MDMDAAPYVLLFQFRRADWAREHEYASFLRTTQLPRENLIAVDVMHAAPDLEQVRGAAGIIIGGSPLSVFEEVPHLDEVTLALKLARLLGIPILGVCFGAQLLAHVWEGRVQRTESAVHEFGTFEVELNATAGLPERFLAQCAHQDLITELPWTALPLARSARCPLQAFVFVECEIYGVQFHPERNKAEYLERLAWKRSRGEDVAEIDAIEAALQEAPLAELIIRNFIERIVCAHKNGCGLVPGKSSP